MQNLLARTKGSSRWLGLCLFAIAFLCAALISGCGSSGSSGGGGTSDSASSKGTTDVIFHFNESSSAKILARAIPQGTTHIRFTGNDNNREKRYGPTEKAYASTITLNNVPVSVTGFVLECIKKDGKNVELTAIVPVDKVSLTEDKENLVIISDSYVKPLSEVVKSVTNTPSEFNPFAIGMSESFTVIATLEGGQTVALTPYLTFTSSDPKVATVEQNGFDGAKVVAQGGGTATISGEVLGVKTNITVTVDPGKRETGVKFVPSTTKVTQGLSVPLEAKMVWNDGTTTEIDKDRVTSYTADPKDAVTIEKTDKGCKVTADKGAKEGTKVTITMTVTNEGGDPFTGKATVEITNKTVVSIAISNDTTGDMLNKLYPTGKNNNSCQFTATVTWSDGAKTDETNTVTWTSSTPTVAAFDETTKGKLNAVAVGETTVFAERDGIKSENSTITVKEPGVTELKTDVYNPEEGFVAYIKDGVGRPYPITVTAVYANGEEKTVALSDLTSEFFRTEGATSSEYVEFQEGEKGAINIVPKSVTDESDSFIRFTYEGKSKDVKIAIKDVLPEKIAINLVDTTTDKTYNINPTDGTYEIGIPYGRSYKIVVRAQANNGEDLGDISGNYEFKDSLVRDEKFEHGLAYPIVVDGMSKDKEWSSSAKIISYAQDYNRAIFSGDDSTPLGDRVYTQYKTIEEKDGVKSVVIKNVSEDARTITVTGQSKADQIEAFQVKVTLKMPAVDKYIAVYNDKDNGTTFDIPRGVDFDITNSGQHKVKAQMSYAKCEASAEFPEEDNLKDVTENMTIDEESITPLLNTFLVEKKAEGSYSSVTDEDAYSSRNKIGQTGNITMKNKWDDKSENFGCEAASGKPFQSFNVEPAEFTLKLERPTIVSCKPVVLGEDGNQVTAETDGKYHFKANTKFQFLLKDVELSDKGKLDHLEGNSTISSIYYEGRYIDIVKLLDPKKIDSLYQVQDSEELSAGAASDIKITPDPHQYYNVSDYVDKHKDDVTITVVLDK